VGDKLLTSGIGGRFPPGFPVGRIDNVAPAATGMFQVALARPAADIDRSTDVLLLHDQAEPEGPPAPASPAGPSTSLGPAPAATLVSPPGKPPADDGVRR